MDEVETEIEVASPVPVGEESSTPEVDEDLAALQEMDSEEEKPEESEEVDLASLARSFGVGDPDLFSLRDGEVRIRTKVDGETQEQPLAEVLKGYQLEAHVTRKSQALREERQRFEEEQGARSQELRDRAALVDKVLGNEQEAIQARYSQVQWDQIRGSDPAQYAALVADYQREMGAAAARRKEVEEGVRKQGQEDQQKLVAAVQQERHRLAERMGWSPQETQTRASQTQKYLVDEIGYAPQDLAQVYDHRFVVVAEKARQWDALKARAAKIKGNPPARKVPAGASGASSSQVNKRAEAALIQRARESGSLDDQVAAGMKILYGK